MVNQESSSEQIESYLAALELEKRGYEARLAAQKSGAREDPLSAAQLGGRVKQVEAEQKRVRALLPA